MYADYIPRVWIQASGFLEGFRMFRALKEHDLELVFSR